ncbi:hypothetical protein Tco_0701594 [Tanacetum coccineum]
MLRIQWPLLIPQKSLDASKSVHELRNYPETANALKVHETIVEEAVDDPFATDFGIKSLGNVDLDKLLKDQKVDDAEIAFSRYSSFDQGMEEANSNLESMPDVEITSIFEGDNYESGSDQELSATNAKSAATTSSPADIQALIAKVVWEKKNIPRVKIPNIQTLGAMRRRLDFLAAKVHNVSENLPNQLTKKFDSTASIVHKIVSEALVQQLPDLLTATIKSILPRALTKAVRETLHRFNRRIKNVIKDEMPAVLQESVLKPMN